MSTNFEYYKVFCQVAKHHSMTLAAQTLNISQPAVSKSIHQLEAALGCVLFQRNKNGVHLTAEGQELYHYAAHAYDLLSRGEERVRSMQELSSGSLCIGTSDMLMHFFLLPYLQKFHNLYPNVKIHLVTGNSPQTTAALRDGRIDVGIIASPVEKSGLITVPICCIYDIFVASKSFSSLLGRDITLQKLTQFPMICCSPGTTTRQFLDSFFLQHNIVLHPEFELESTDMIVPFAESGLGVGVVLRTLASESLQRGTLFEIHTCDHLPTRKVCAIALQGSKLSCAAQSFMEGLTTGGALSKPHKLL